MSLLERLTRVPPTLASGGKPAGKGGHLKFPLLRTSGGLSHPDSTVQSSAVALRPSTPIFAILLLVFFPPIGVNLSSAASPDIRLLPLIPPGSEVVAGIRRRWSKVGQATICSSRRTTGSILQTSSP